MEAGVRVTHLCVVCDVTTAGVLHGNSARIRLAVNPAKQKKMVEKCWFTIIYVTYLVEFNLQILMISLNMFKYTF